MSDGVRNTITEASRSWFEQMNDDLKTVQSKLDSLDLGQPDNILAAQVRGLTAEKKALQLAIENADKFFRQ